MKNPFLATKYGYCFASLYVCIFIYTRERQAERGRKDKGPVYWIYKDLCQISRAVRDDFPRIAPGMLNYKTVGGVFEPS